MRKKGIGVWILVTMVLATGCAHIVNRNSPGVSLREKPVEKVSSMNEYPKYREIVSPAGYVNTDNITIGELIGKKVVLVEFLTYSCINCIRTFPHVNAWYGRYKDRGLEIVGIHTPEFASEKKYENVVSAMKKHSIQFPIVLDNTYATWRAYGNDAWPRLYLIDIHGNIIYDHIGEGNYEETEKKIQEALEERERFLGQEIVATVHTN